jgi:hypothetical protein
MLSRPDALVVAGRLAASFPSPAIAKPTIAEWAEEFVGCDPDVAEATIDRIKAKYDRAPTIRAIRSALLTERNAAERARLHAKALSWEASPAGQPTTFAEWAETDPERARKLATVLTGESDVRKSLEAAVQAFDALASHPHEPTPDERYTWSRVDPPCKFCGRRVANGPDAASRYDADTDTWTNVHLSCAEPAAYAQSESPR